jgi:hypothetical protein
VDYAEFSGLAEMTIRGMYDRIPAEYHEDFEDLFIGGEVGFAVETLIGGLKRLSIPIKPSERDNLAILLRSMNQPESELEDLTVIERHQSNP